MIRVHLVALPVGANPLAASHEGSIVEWGLRQTPTHTRDLDDDQRVQRVIVGDNMPRPCLAQELERGDGLMRRDVHAGDPAKHDDVDVVHSVERIERPPTAHTGYE